MISSKKTVTILKRVKPFDDDEYCKKLYLEYKNSETSKRNLALKNNLSLYYYEKCILRGFDLLEN